MSGPRVVCGGIDGLFRSGRRAQVVVLVAASIAAVLTVVAAQHLFPRGSPNLDEVAYDAQARALLHGDLTLPRAMHDPFFRPFVSGFRDDRVVFKYQPVWPALVAASRDLVRSTLPLRALLAAAGVFATYAFAQELLRRRKIAAIAAVIVALSPFVWLQSATLLGYQLSFVLGIAGAAAVIRTIRTRGRRAAFAAGLLLGFAAFHRPFDALIAALPVLVYAVIALRASGRLARLTGAAALGALPTAIMLAAFDTAVMGAPWRLPFGVSGPIDKFGFGWRATFVVAGTGHDGQVHFTRGTALHATWESLLTFPRFVFAAPVVLLLAGYVVARKWRDARVRLLVAMIATLIVAYFFWWGVANAVEFELYDALGPFYHYLALSPLAVLAAWGLSLLRPTPALVTALAIVAVAWTVPATSTVMHDARHAGNVRAAELALTTAPGRRLVLQDPMFPRDPYVRVANDPDLDGTRIVGIDIPGRRLDAVEQFPGRTAYLVRGFHPAGEPLSRIRREQVRLRIVEGARVTITSTGDPSEGRTATSYLRIADDERIQPGAGAVWDVQPADLPATPVSIVAGYRTGPDEFVECRFEGRRVSDDLLRVLTPCDGFAGYAFPDGTTAVSREDVSDRLTVSVGTR
jgi:hypothetical protein